MTNCDFLSNCWREPSKQVLDGSLGLVSSSLFLLHFVVLQGSLHNEISQNWDWEVVGAFPEGSRFQQYVSWHFHGFMNFLYNIDHLNGILSQHGAVKLHWRKGQFLTRLHLDSRL